MPTTALLVDGEVLGPGAVELGAMVAVELGTGVVLGAVEGVAAEAGALGVDGTAVG